MSDALTAPPNPELPRADAAAEGSPGGRPAGWAALRWALAALLVGGAALVASAMLWQKLSHIQEELARRSTEAGVQAVEARTLAREAQEGTRELTARIATLESRLGEVSLQRGQLEELMQSLSRSRDEHLVVELESTLRLAQQQAQLTGSAESLLAALRAADSRLARAAQPRLSPVQRAIAKDTERVKSAVLTDVPALLLKLDELTRAVDELPVANAIPAANPQRAPLSMQPAARPSASRPPASSSSPSSSASDSASSPIETAAEEGFGVARLRHWWAHTLQVVQDEARSLLRISRIDRPEAALLAPEQSFFLRENLKLKLLNARLALLSRQTETARTDLAAAQTLLGRYFDPGARRTQAALSLLQQVQTQLRSAELPRLDDTLAALSTAAAGR